MVRTLKPKNCEVASLVCVHLIAAVLLGVAMSTTQWVRTTIYLDGDPLQSSLGLFKNCEDDKPCVAPAFEDFTCLTGSVRSGDDRRARRKATVAMAVLAEITTVAAIAPVVVKWFGVASIVSGLAAAFHICAVVVFAQTEMYWKTCGMSVCQWNRPPSTPCRFELQWSFWMACVSTGLVSVLCFAYAGVLLKRAWVRRWRQMVEEEMQKFELSKNNEHEMATKKEED